MPSVPPRVLVRHSLAGSRSPPYRHQRVLLGHTAMNNDKPPLGIPILLPLLLVLLLLAMLPLCSGNCSPWP